MLNCVHIKPLSVNECWQGRRFKTKKYKVYTEKLLEALPDVVEIPEGKLYVEYIFGLSSKNADWDNLVKPFQDILSQKYGFNDKVIYESHILKEDVKKGEEFCMFKIMKVQNSNFLGCPSISRKPTTKQEVEEIFN